MTRTTTTPPQTVTTPDYMRRFEVGAEVIPGGGVAFRVWAPQRQSVQVVFEGDLPPATLEPQDNGYFAGIVAEAKAGMRYRFRLDDDPTLYPDPVSRFQPEGPHGPSEIIDPRFDWTDGDWQGVTCHGQVTYEMHIGTFTPEGNWAAAIEQLPELANLGITLLEVMPVADYDGEFNWGYDGVNLFAPTRNYGRPEEFRRFVDRAHALGMGVILDVVYNHLGPSGNYLPQFAKDYFTDRHSTDWGEAINYDGENCGPVREFYITNAAYWVTEFHLDGLRLDATQDIHDDSTPHILEEIGQAVRLAGRKRSTYIVAENEPQESLIVRSLEAGGYGLDALWNDDFHHSARVALTGRREAYYTDYLGTPQEFISAAKYGYLYQGQHYSWQKKRRGMPTFGVPPEAFVTFMENHDQIANSASGQRIHQLTSPGNYRTMTALLLLGPGTPLLFQGQEFAASAPFLFFADHEPELAKLVDEGRRGFLEQFPSVKLPAIRDRIPAASARSTFELCKLNLGERQTNAWAYNLTRDLLRLRREDPVISGQNRTAIDGAVLGPKAFVLRYFADDGLDRLLVFNLGDDCDLVSAPEPLLAPPAGCQWDVHWSSETPEYGGHGAPSPDEPNNWHLAGQAATLLIPVRLSSKGT